VKKPTETALVKSLLEYLALRQIPAWRQNQGAVRKQNADGKERFFRFAGAEGISDILGLLPPAGRFLAVEAKRPGEGPTPKQARFLAKIAAAGGLAIVAHDVTELRAALEEAGYR
jgi:hypothetical protein